MQDQPCNDERLYLIDASIFIFRYYFSMPSNWESTTGYDSSAVYGYARWLAKLIRELQPDYCVVCFDESLGSCFRNDIYSGYKASSALPDEALSFQLVACKHLTKLMGLPIYASDTHEADDLIGTLAARWRECGAESGSTQDKPVTVISRDKDLAQVIQREADQLWDYPKGVRHTAADLHQIWGITTQQVPDFLALTGDASDDIPGVPGLGPKTAAALLTEFDSWSHIKNKLPHIANLSLRGAKKWAAILPDYVGQVDMALQLTTIDCNAPMPEPIKFTRAPHSQEQLHVLCRYLGVGKVSLPYFTSAIC